MLSPELPLEPAARHEAAVVSVLGRPDFHDPLGFAEAAPLGWRCIYDVPSAAFRVHRLGEGAGLPPSGTVRYHPAFDSL